jgi:tetratricopeptide (TPR) repeat protein
VKSDDTVTVLKEPLPDINPVSITKEDQNLRQINILTPKAVDEPDMSQPTLNSETTPQKELLDIQKQENKEPVIVMASVDMESMNRIEKPIDIVNVQSSDEPALIKDQTENLVLAQNETAENPDLNSAAVPNNAISNVTPEDAAIDTKNADIDNAIADITRQIELNDSDAGLYVLRGNLHMDKQDYEQAVSDYTKAIEINPDDAAAYNNRGQAFVNIWEEYSYWRQAYADRWEEYSYRIQRYEKMGKLFRYTNKGEFTQAMKDDKLADKAFEKALKDFKKAIKKNPENIHAYINRGNAYYASQKYRKAISDYTRAVKIDPEFSLAYINRGVAYLQNGSFGIRYGSSFSNAVKDFSKALELNNRDAWTYLLRGDVYNNKRKYRQAISDYNKAIELNPYLINAYNNCGMAYESMGELDKAILEYSRAIEIISENPDAFINHYSFSKEGKTHNDAIFYATTYHYADNYLNNRHKGTSGIRYGVTLILTPEVLSPDYNVFEPLDSYILRGLAYEKNNQLDKAISDFSRVIEQNPKHCLGYKYRSEIYRKMGNEGEYKNDLEMAENYGYKTRPTTEYRYGTHIQQGYWEGYYNADYYWRRDEQARAQALQKQMSDEMEAKKGMEAKKAKSK